MAANPTCDGVFHSNVESTRLLVEFVEGLGLEAPPARLLDIGCGVGEHTLALAARFSLAEVVGLDIVPESVAAAGRAAVAAGVADRVRFVCADYARWRDGEFQLVTAMSVLHLMGGAMDDILPRVVSDVAEGGFLVFTLPDGSMFNHALWGVRRLARLCRGRVLDRLLLAVAGMLHGGEYSEDMLRERLRYMYLLPGFHYGRRMRWELERRGMSLAAESAMPHASIAQPKHRLVAYHRGPAGSIAGSSVSHRS